MVKKIASYILGGVGVLGLFATSVPKVWESIKIPANLAGVLSQLNVTIISIALILIAVIILKKSRNSKKDVEKEVPIYSDKDVVGFRRIKGK